MKTWTSHPKCKYMRPFLVFVSNFITYSDKEEEKKIYTEIIKLVPTFKELITACSGHRRAFLNLLKMVSLHILFIVIFIPILFQLQNAANNARNDDVAKTNSMIHDYVKPAPRGMLPYYDAENYPMPSPNRPEERGWSHPEYAVLLCPNIMLDCFSPNDYE
jgi:uncharacterized protein DUF6698